MSGLNLVKDNASFNTALVLKVVWVCACVVCISWVYAEISWWIKTSVRKIWIIVYLFFTNTCKTSLESPLCADSREVIWMNSRSYFFFFQRSWNITSSNGVSSKLLSFLRTQAHHIFSSKSISILDFICVRIYNESLTIVLQNSR